MSATFNVVSCGHQHAQQAGPPLFVEQEPSSVDALSRCADQTNETKPPCYYYAQFTPPVRHDKTVLSVSCQAVSIESARPPDKCVLRRSASGGRTGSACAARHTPTLNAVVGWSGRLTSHRHTRHDKTVLSVSRLMCRGVNWTIALNVFRLQISCLRVRQS